MISVKTQEALNKQINEELYSSYLYLSMSAYCQTKNLAGMANWFRVQAQEELIHVMKFFDYINDRGGLVKLQPVAGPQQEWTSFLKAFEDAYAHEQKITAMINELVDLSIKEKDRMTENFLQWFVSEQVEEEASVSEIVGQLRLIGNEGSGIFMVDRELAQRVFVPPTAAAGT